MRRGCVWGAVAALGGLLAAAVPAAAGEKLLLGFEKEESLKYAGYKEDKGDSLVIRYNAYGTYHYMRKGDATEGQWALRWTTKGAFDPMGGGAGESGLAGVQRTGRVLNGSGWMAGRGLCGDWSGYDRLLVDVRASAPVRLRFSVADRETVPVAQRVFEVPAGKWVTLEFDLAAAADPRRLDRSKLKPGEDLFFRCEGGALYPARPLDRAAVHGVFLNVLKAEAGAELLADNLRLVPAGAKPEGQLPLVTDPSPWPVPEPLPAETRPSAPERRPVSGQAADERPVQIDLAGVAGTTYGRMHNDRCGIAVADAEHLAINLAAGMNRAVLVTADGGRTWKGLDGADKPTTLFSGNLMMVGACCAPGDDGPDLLFVTLNHCSGGEEPSWVWFSRVRRAGASWKAEPARVIDVDSWHCPEHAMDTVRLPNGRLWAAWSPASRAGGIAARYSDDDGATWRALPGRIGKGAHGEKRPLLVPYGDEVACFFGCDWHPMFSWAASEGGKWTPTTQPVPGLKGRPVAGAQLAPKELMVAVAGEGGGTDKLLHLTDGKWSEEPGAPFQPTRLAVAGKRLVAFRVDGKRILAAVRDPAGKWGPAREVAAEEEGAADLAVPRQAPEGFVPIAWTPKSGKWIKFLRVPLPTAGK